MEPSIEAEDPTDHLDDCRPQHFGYKTAREAVEALHSEDGYPVDPDDPHMSQWGF